MLGTLSLPAVSQSNPPNGLVETARRTNQGVRTNYEFRITSYSVIGTNYQIQTTNYH
jgi:hypothetical protein